ncbi:MAG: flippase [Sedimentisphaerales bacterium]|nr:flippase [Sedimentisphaerales bacterium]
MNRINNGVTGISNERTQIKEHVFLIMTAKAVWVLSNFVIHVGVGRLLGPVQYGEFGVILSILSIGFLVLGNGLRQAIVKYVAESPESNGAMARTGLVMQLIFSLIITAGIIVFAELIATALHDKSITNLIRLSALTLPFIGLIYTYVAELEGKRRFGKTALVTITYSVSKVVLVFILVGYGFKLYGAITGYVLATILSALVAIYFCPRHRKTGKSGIIKLLKFGFPTLLFFVGMALLMNIDIMFVKSMLVDGDKTGFYSSARALSRVVYFVFQAFAIVLLPTISKSFKNNDMKLVRQHICESFRYILVFLVPIAAIVCASSKEIISLFYGNDYSPGAASLSVLIFGMSFLALALVLAAIIQGYGKPAVPMYVLLSLIPVVICLNIILIPRYELVGAALATSITCFLGFAAMAIYVIKEFSVLISILSLLRVVAASVVIYFITVQFLLSGYLLPVYLAGVFCVYFFMLFVLGELTAQDLAFIKEIRFRLGPEKADL